MRPTLEAALEYAARGWHVFPLRPGSKFPATEHGHLDATVDESQIREWFTWTDFNVGTSLEPSGLLVLDVDVAEGKQGAASLATLDAELADTLAQRTGRGGLQAVFARGDLEARRVIGFLPGLDLLGKGYIVLPPSTLYGDEFKGAVEGADGAYAWIDAGASIAPPPVALRRIVETRATGSLTRQSEGPAPGTMPTITEGGRNDALFRVAAALRRQGLSLRAVHAAILSENLERFSPPLDASEVARIAESACRYTPERDVATSTIFGAGVLAEAERVDDPLASLEEPVELSPFAQAVADALVEITTALGLASDASAAPAPLFMSGLDLLAATFPPTSWLVRGLITEGGTGLLGGEPKTSKTWGLVEIAIALCTGTPAFGEFVVDAPRTVAYFFAEDLGPSVRSRFTSLCAGRGLDPTLPASRFFPQPRGRFLDVLSDSDLALIVASCRAIGKVDVLMLEPLRDLHSGEENSSDSMREVFRRLRLLGEIISRGQDAKCTVITAHHMTKNSGDKRPGQGLRGSSAVHGALDSGLYLSDLRGDETTFINTVNSEVKFGRSAGVFTLTLKVEDGPDGTAVRAAWTVERGVVKKDDAKAQARAERVIEAVRSAPGGFLSKTQIASTIGGNANAVRAVIDDLVERGVLELTWVHPLGGQMLKHAVVIVSKRGERE